VWIETVGILTGSRAADRSRDRRYRDSLKASGGGEIAMLLFMLVMLGIGVPSNATGFADVDDGAEPGRAEATRTLTDGERLFQGIWQYHGYESGKNLGTLRIEGHDFHADIIHGSYAGTVSIRSDTSPAQIDFKVEHCECKFDGMTSAGIYDSDVDGTIVFATRAPGEPRLETFADLDPTRHEIVRLRPLDPPIEGDDTTPW
jgi:hypothetical protein